MTTTTDNRSIKDLFRAWRSGDAASGQLMAQRFADWYMWRQPRQPVRP